MHLWILSCFLHCFVVITLWVYYCQGFLPIGNARYILTTTLDCSDGCTFQVSYLERELLINKHFEPPLAVHVRSRTHSLPQSTVLSCKRADSSLLELSAHPGMDDVHTWRVYTSERNHPLSPGEQWPQYVDLGE